MVLLLSDDEPLITLPAVIGHSTTGAPDGVVRVPLGVGTRLVLASLELRGGLSLRLSAARPVAAGADGTHVDVELIDRYGDPVPDRPELLARVLVAAGLAPATTRIERN
ncbi:MAG TPA: hypothetical protein VGC45_05460 [Gryllotalpicola sp.]